MLKAVISGYYGFKNFGDEAILQVLLSHLKALGVEATVFSSDPKYTQVTYDVKSVKNFDIKKLIKSIINSDMLISGGGSLLQDVTSLKSLVYYSAVIALGILFNKKVIIFAQGIGPINNKYAQIVVKNLLKMCTLVTVRDENSLKLLDDWHIKSKLVCDPIYSMKINKKPTEAVVGVQLRDFKTMNYNLLHKLALFIVTKFSDKKIELFSLQKSQDLELCKRFEKLLKTLNPDLEIEIIEQNIIEEISKLEVLIAMRFHAILTALKCGVKTCAINYDIKVEKLAKDANLPIVSMQAEENFEEIYSKLQNLNNEELSKFANAKHFDWADFDNLLI
jgi:polysaccharide pyruvyl transferase CsaB